MGELIVPGTLGILTDVAGLLVILVTTIPQMRDLGVFGAFWVAAIVVTVEILHPILICWLPAPHDYHHYTPGFMQRFVGWLGNLVTDPVGRWVVVGVFAVALPRVGRGDLGVVDDRRGAARHPAVLAESPVQPGDREDRREVRRLGRARGVRRGRPQRGGRRRRGAAEDAGARARADQRDRRRRVRLAGAAGARREPHAPLRRAEAGDHSRGLVGPRDPALHALQQPAGRADLDPDQRRARRDGHRDLSRPQGRDDPEGRRGRRGVHRREPDGHDPDPARQGQGRARRAVLQPGADQGLRLLHDRAAAPRARAHARGAAPRGGPAVRPVRGEDRREGRPAAVDRGLPQVGARQVRRRRRST